MGGGHGLAATPSEQSSYEPSVRLQVVLSLGIDLGLGLEDSGAGIRAVDRGPRAAKDWRWRPEWRTSTAKVLNSPQLYEGRRWGEVQDAGTGWGGVSQGLEVEDGEAQAEG